MKKTLSLNSSMREVKIYFVIHLLGASLSTCGYFTLMGFQTSFYVEDGLGATGLTVLLSFTAVGAFVGPAFLEFFSLKAGLIFFDFSALVYCAANYYAEFYTLIPASVFTGLGTAVFWICSGSFNVYFAKLLANCGSKSFESYSNMCGGFLFSAITAAQVIGNAITYVAFETDAPSSSEDGSNATAETINFSSTVSLVTSVTRFPVSEVCGAKDCQDPEVTAQNISSYVPPNPVTLYIVLSVLTALCLIALVLQLLFVPTGTIPDQTLTSKYFCDNDGPNAASSIKSSSNTHCTNELYPNYAEKEMAKKTKQKSKTEINKLQTVWKEILLTLRHFIKPNQLLFAGLQFYIGFARSFLLSEITRSYVSCVYGVSEVGICLVIYNATAFFVAMICGKVCEKYGRIYPIIFAFVCDMAVYIFCLLWIPTESSSNWIVYGLYFVTGTSASVFASTTVAAVASFYPDSSSRGFTCWTVITTCSGMIQNAWSTSLCVNYKIYVLIAVLCFAIVTHIIAEYRHARSLLEVNAEENEDRKEENEISSL